MHSTRQKHVKMRHFKCGCQVWCIYMVWNISNMCWSFYAILKSQLQHKLWSFSSKKKKTLLSSRKINWAKIDKSQNGLEMNGTGICVHWCSCCCCCYRCRCFCCCCSAYIIPWFEYDNVLFYVVYRIWYNYFSFSRL